MFTFSTPSGFHPFLAEVNKTLAETLSSRINSESWTVTACLRLALMFKSRMGPQTRTRRRQGAKSPFPSFNLYSDRVKQLPWSLLAAVHKILRLAVFVFPNRTLARRPDWSLGDIGVCLRVRACAGQEHRRLNPKRCWRQWIEKNITTRAVIVYGKVKLLLRWDCISVIMYETVGINIYSMRAGDGRHAGD